MNGMQVLMILILITANSMCSWTCPSDCICLSQTQVNQLYSYCIKSCTSLLYIISHFKIGIIPTTELDTTDILKSTVFRSNRIYTPSKFSCHAVTSMIPYVDIHNICIM